MERMERPTYDGLEKLQTQLKRLQSKGVLSEKQVAKQLEDYKRNLKREERALDLSLRNELARQKLESHKLKAQARHMKSGLLLAQIVKEEQPLQGMSVGVESKCERDVLLPNNVSICNVDAEQRSAGGGKARGEMEADIGDNHSSDGDQAESVGNMAAASTVPAMIRRTTRDDWTKAQVIRTFKTLAEACDIINKSTLWGNGWSPWMQGRQKSGKTAGASGGNKPGRRWEDTKGNHLQLSTGNDGEYVLKYLAVEGAGAPSLLGELEETSTCSARKRKRGSSPQVTSPCPNTMLVQTRDYTPLPTPIHCTLHCTPHHTTPLVGCAENRRGQRRRREWG